MLSCFKYQDQRSQTTLPTSESLFLITLTQEIYRTDLPWHRTDLPVRSKVCGFVGVKLYSCIQGLMTPSRMFDHVEQHHTQITRSWLFMICLINIFVAGGHLSPSMTPWLRSEIVEKCSGRTHTHTHTHKQPLGERWEQQPKPMVSPRAEAHLLWSFTSDIIMNSTFQAPGLACPPPPPTKFNLL